MTDAITTFTTYLLQMLDDDRPDKEIDEQARMISAELGKLPREERQAAISTIHGRLSGNGHAALVCSILGIEPLERDGDEASGLLDNAVSDLLENIADLESIEQDDAIAALMGNLALMDGFQFERWRGAILKKKLMRARVFDEEIKRRRVDLQEQDEEAKAEKPVTWPYRVEHGRINYLYYRSGPDGTKLESNPVCDFTATIKQEIVDEDGKKTFVVEGLAVRGGAFLFEMDAEDFGNDRKLKAKLDAASGALSPIRAGMSKHLSPSIELLTPDDIIKIKRYQCTGWVDNRFLIPGREPSNIVINLEGQMPYRINQEADLGTGIDALRFLLKSINPELSTVIVSFVFQAPLARLTAWSHERYAIFSSGRTGSFKTSFAQCAMSIYGPDFMRRELLIKWGPGTTANAIMHLAVRLHDMPVLVDNFKPTTGDGIRGFVNLTHNILEGGEKLRLKRSTDGLRSARPAFCWPYFTGEDVPDTDTASLARILIVPFEWQRGEISEDFKQVQRLASHLCAVGNSWIEWLEDEDARKAIIELNSENEFIARREKWMEKLKKVRSDIVNIWRVAVNLATNELAWETLMMHPVMGQLAKDFQEFHQAGLEQIVAREMADATAGAMEGVKFITILRELITTKRAILKRRDIHVNPMTDDERALYNYNKDRIIGWQDAAGIYLLPGVTRSAIERLMGSDALGQLSNAAIYKHLDNMGLLLRGRNKSTKTLQMEGESERVIHLVPEALDPNGDDDEEPIPF